MLSSNTTEICSRKEELEVANARQMYYFREEAKIKLRLCCATSRPS